MQLLRITTVHYYTITANYSIITANYYVTITTSYYIWWFPYYILFRKVYYVLLPWATWRCPADSVMTA